jgi:DNA topoisomerase-6 subunit B
VEKTSAPKKARKAPEQAQQAVVKGEGGEAGGVPSRRRQIRDVEVESKPARETSESKMAKTNGTAKKKKKNDKRLSAEAMAAKQREISVSEFFTKNRHLLGFDNPAKALLTTVKEAVDNSLDACEEAGILPKIRVVLREMADDRYQVLIEDNGPGIVKQQIPKIFGKLLYGSKFHRLKQSRGQQGIGISAAGMYGQLTTGKAVVITSRTKPHRPANQFEIALNTRKNQPEVINERQLDSWQVEHGTRVEIELQGTYKAGRNSVDAYLEQVAIANPHAEITYVPPKGKPPVHQPRATEDLPSEPGEIKPHPYGIELGMLMKLLKESKNRTLSGTLQNDFSRVTSRVALKICEAANLRPKCSPRTLPLADMERLYKAIPKVKIMAPQTSCVVPIGEELIQKGLEREIKADLYVSATRPPTVYRGNPFRVEVGLAYGGELRDERSEDDETSLDLKNGDRSQGPIRLIRFANRVPLQYQQSACAIFKAVTETNWKPYGLSHPRGSLPRGPMVLLVHLASVWVPFTSESKEAIAHYPEIIKEIKLALRECGRKLSSYLRRKEKAILQAKRRSIFEVYVGELVESLNKLTGADKKRLHNQLLRMTGRHTAGEEAAALAGVADGASEVEAEGEAPPPTKKKPTKKKTAKKTATKKTATKKTATKKTTTTKKKKSAGRRR